MRNSNLIDASPFLDGEVVLTAPERETSYDLARIQTPFLTAELTYGQALPEEPEPRETPEAPAGNIVTFTAKTLPVKTAVLVTQAAKQARQVEVLLFAHGLDAAGPAFKNRPLTFITGDPFRLGDLVEASGRPIVLVVPFLDWENLAHNGMAFGNQWHKLAKPANLNGVVAEALENVPGLTGAATAPAILRLILAGHSRAFGIFDALARAHADAEMSQGALAHLSNVWAFDTTYTSPIGDWREWLRSRDSFSATIIYRHGTYRARNGQTRPLTTGVHGSEFRALAEEIGNRLTVIPVPAAETSHFAIPAVYLPRLLQSQEVTATHHELAEEETGVIGSDNRVRVTPTTGVPFRWICRVDVKGNRDSQPGGGTGVLISDRHVLTAAHVVYEAAQNMQNYSIEVKPALDWADEPFGSYSVSDKPKLPANYHPDNDDHLDWDYALLKLSDPVSKKLCHWGSPQCGQNSMFERPDPAHLNGKAVITAGYPGSSGGKKMMQAAGILHSVQQQRRTMGITADTTKGQSGSPIWIDEGGKSKLVGIAVGASGQSNFAVRVTRELIRQLRTWIAADGVTPSMIETEEELESPDVEFEEADQATEDDAPSFEMDIPTVGQADLKTRIKEYFDLANAEYTLKDGTKVKARPQFRYAKAGGTEAAIENVKGILGKQFEKDHPNIIHMAAYGRAKPRDIQAINQALIDKGKLPAGSSTADDIRQMQHDFRMGIDCAGYVQLAFIYAFKGKDDDPPDLRESLGLQARRGDEVLSDLPRTHFKKVPVTDARTGDLFVLNPRAGDTDRAGHTMIVLDHIKPAAPDTVHSFVVHASWGTDTYGPEHGGVEERTLKFDTATGKWWDIDPRDGSDAFPNTVGPYNKHIIDGMYRPIQK
jgi:V8-like Glu-specific endopeptidase